MREKKKKNQTEYSRASETCGDVTRSNAYGVRVPGGEEREERVEAYSDTQWWETSSI